MMNRIVDFPNGQRLPSGQQRPGAQSRLPAPEAGQDLKAWIEPVEELITHNPGAAVAAAFLIGVALAWWIKRR